MKSYICIYCGHEVIAEEKPQLMRWPVLMEWTDGHICRFVEEEQEQNGVKLYYSVELGRYVTVPGD